jgi:hypothetical protein
MMLLQYSKKVIIRDSKQETIVESLMNVDKLFILTPTLPK